MARFSSRNYSWTHMEVRVNGLILAEFVGLEWNHEQELEFIYGKGTKPMDIGEGNEQTTGTLTMLQGDVETLLDVSPEGKLVKLKNIDIQVAFQKPGELEIVRYSFTGVRFTSQPMGLRQNDKRMEVAIPFMALDYRRV